MTVPPEPQDFDTLRLAAIGYAQAASGNIWTDYNLHDPGVTLLEQTCFALSELSYQATHTTADLLTDDTGHIHFTPLSLFLPADVLPGDPVTLLDVAAALGEVAGVARVLVSRGPRAGLLDAVVIPARAVAAVDKAALRAQLRENVQTAFDAHRPLACDLNLLHVAKRTPARLSGVVEISATAIPERVAAEIYYHVSAILRGQAITHQTGATRQTVYDHPQSFLHAPSDQDGKTPNLEDYLDTFREIPGVTDVSMFSLARQHLAPPDDGKRAEMHYLDLTLPETVGDIDLDLTLEGVSLTLDPGQILEEFVRISADHIAHAQHHLDPNDWVPPPDGHRRAFDPAPVDALLPGVYGAGAKTSPEAGLLVRYRSAVNAHLTDMSITLRDLPSFLTATTNANSNDPAVRRQRIDLLDYLIAHQGAEMPVTRHAGLHHYRSASERAFFDLRWRLDFLAALPYLNGGRGGGPDGEAPGAFLAKFRLLADLEASRNLTHGLNQAEFSIDPQAPQTNPDFDRADLLLPDNPFDMLVPHDPAAQPLSDEALREASPWITQGACLPDLFIRAADPQAFIVSQMAQSTFGVFFDAGNQTHLHTCASFDTVRDAMTFTQRLRTSWKAIHANAEGAYLIEDILLRSASTDFAPNKATMVLTGWTARTSQPTYRAYVERLLDALSPAHVVVEPCWLSHSEMMRFEAVYGQYLAAEGDAKRQLRALLIEWKTTP